MASSVKNDHARLLFEGEYVQYAKRYRADAFAPIQNKIGVFLADLLLCRELTNPRKPLDLRSVMDESKILLVNLSKGQLGEDTAGLLGALLATSLGLAGFSRADLSPYKRRLHFVYMDEFQKFTTLSMANIFSEIRKQNIGLVLAHQAATFLYPVLGVLENPNMKT